MNGAIPPTDACCANNGSGVLYVWRDINSVCVTAIVELFIIQHVQNILSLLRSLYYTENKVMRVIVYRLVLLPHIRKALLEMLYLLSRANGLS